jgi:hypothetical protein
MKKMNYGFALAFDEEAPRGIKLPFIPARLLLDQRGRLRSRLYCIGVQPFERKHRAIRATSGAPVAAMQPH